MTSTAPEMAFAAFQLLQSPLPVHPPHPPPPRTHQQARLVGLDALRERLLDVDGAADAVLGGAQG